MEFGPQHLGDVVLGFLRAIHFTNARHQLHGALAVIGHLLLGGDRPVAGNHGIEIELQRRTQRAGPFHRAAAARIIDQLGNVVALGVHVAGRENAIGREQHHHVAVGVRAAEMIERHVLAAEINVRVMFDHDVGKARLVGHHHLLASFLGRHHLHVHGLELGVAAAMVAVVMRVDHVLHRLVGDLFQLSHDAGVIDIEFVVHQQHAVIGDQRRGVARHEIVVDYVQVVLELDGVQLRGLISKLRVRGEQGAAKRTRPRTIEQRSFCAWAKSISSPL